jgi:FixJ family two-component response regulator
MNRDRVVIVDDEVPILHAVGRLMAFESFALVSATTGAEALARLAENDTAVLLADYHLDDMDGVDLLRQVRKISPDTSRILFSGDIDVELLRGAVNAGEVYRFIAKPWNDDELLMAVRHGIERWQLVRRNRALHHETEEQNRRLSRFADELEVTVAARTEDLELRNRALSLSQEALDHLPVVVLGLAPDGCVAMLNALGRRLFPELIPGDSRIEHLPNELRVWLACTHGVPATTCHLTGPFGRVCFEAMDLGERGLVLTALPLPPPAEPGGRL